MNSNNSFQDGYLDLEYNVNCVDDSIEQACRLLNRPKEIALENGHTNELVAASIDQNGNIAWAEEILNESYVLYIKKQDQEVVEWNIETYNPWFGCDVGLIRWYGDEVAVLYREKHLCIAAVISSDGKRRRLANISHGYDVFNDHIYFKNYGFDLIEVLELPSLERKQPIPEIMSEERVKNIPPLNLTEDKSSFISSIKSQLFNDTKNDSDKDVIIGSVLFPYWISSQHIWSCYDDVFNEQRWEEPDWFAYYWYLFRNEDEQIEFIKLMETIIDFDIGAVDSQHKYALIHLQYHIERLNKACSSRVLPKECRRYRFWDRENLKSFDKQLNDFPKGFIKAYKALKWHRKKWAAIDEEHRLS